MIKSFAAHALGLVSALLLSACAADTSENGESAADLATSGAPVTAEDLIGNYDPTAAPLRNAQVKDWGGSPLLSGKYLYGDQLYPVEYVLRPAAGSTSQYIADSSVTVFYGPQRCNYATSIEVNTTRDTSGNVNLYIRDNIPGSLPQLLPVGAPCPHLQNTWRVHQSPYVKRGASQIFAGMMDDLCDDISARIGVVEQAKHLAAGPMADPPANIYVASGSWQSLSTPGRDQRLKESFRGVYKFVNDNASSAQQFLGIWNQHVSTCRFSYKNSNARAIPFTLNDVQTRLFDLSFDPYQCTEMRWGAYPGDTAEFATCNTQDEAHVKRFNDEKSLRNIVDRPAAGTLTPLGYGPAEHEDLDVFALLSHLAQ